MAKSAYKIPYDLNASYADMEIAVRSSDGLGFKPMPMKIIFTYLGGGLICFWAVMNTFLKYGSLPQKLFFAAVWALFLVLLCKYDDTKRMQFSLVPTLFNYLPKSQRVVMTRRDSSALPFYGLVGLKKDGFSKGGMLSFEDGTYGYMYRVIGSASILLFESDKQQILDRVDAYWRKMNTECESIFITVKSSQAVYKQLSALKSMYDNLEERDPDLVMLCNEQFDVLKNHVGGSFKSIHQYLILKADNKEMLQQSKGLLQSEVENSSKMIKRCVALTSWDDVRPVLETIYKGGGR